MVLSCETEMLPDFGSYTSLYVLSNDGEWRRSGIVCCVRMYGLLISGLFIGYLRRQVISAAMGPIHPFES